MSSYRPAAWFLAGVVLLLAGCARAVNPAAQELTRERWQKCSDFPGVRLSQILPDGRIRIFADSRAEAEAWRQCMQQAEVEQRRRGPERLASPALLPAREQGPAPVARADSPLWKRGDEWAYRWETPQGQGLFVWSVNREEIVDGQEYYVIASGPREMYWRKSDLAIYMDKVGGKVEERNVPPRLLYVWPLEPGRAWEQTFTREQFPDGRAETISVACLVEAEETITVPAGTFPTLKIVCRNQATGMVINETWYSPKVMNRVREWLPFPDGIWQRELKSYKLD